MQAALPAALPYVVLFAMGIGWGLTLPLAKIATSTGHEPYGLIFWQLVVVILVLAPFRLRRPLSVPLGWKHLRLFAVVALAGAVLPDVFFYLSAANLPGGVLSIVASASPMFAMCIALPLGNDQFSWPRLCGLGIGLIAIVLMVAPDTSLPDPGMAIFVFIALMAPALYAAEANIVGRWGTYGLDPVETILGASTLGLVFSLPLAFMTDQWVDPFANFGAAEIAMVLGAAIHAVVYATFVWLVGKAGSVFASQSAYIVTATGVVGSMILLEESYSIFIWIALALMMLGIFLVQPRHGPKSAEAEAA